MSDKSRHGEVICRKMTYKDAERLTYFCEDMGFYFVMIIFCHRSVYQGLVHYDFI